MRPKAFEYDGRRWAISATVGDCDSFYHAVFGTRDSDDALYYDRHAKTRRSHLATFLITYFENKPRPARLKQQLTLCLTKRTYEEYAQEIRGRTCPITIEEAPIVAAFENVRIVLFRDDDEKPDIYDVEEELLGDYPLRTKSQSRDAVVYLKGGVYSQMNPLEDKGNQEPSASGFQKPETVHPGLKKADRYHKLEFDSITGILYQVNVATVILLKALKTADQWRLSVDNGSAGYFDDVVFENTSTGEAILIQTKFTNRLIGYRDMFHMNLRHTFSLPRYFRSYQQIKGNFRIKNVVICTNTQLNRAFEPSLQAEIMGEDHLLYHDEAYKFYHTIKEISDDLRNGITRYDGERGEAPAEDEDIMDFLRRLQIVTRYPPSGKLDQAIETIVAGSGLCENLERREYASHINARMMEWYDDKRGRYLTESDAKGYLCEFRSSKLCENLRHLRISFKPDDLRKPFNKLLAQDNTQILHIVPQNEQTLSLVKVYQCLESEESRALFFTTEDAVGLQQQMVEVFRLPKYRYLIVCLKTLEWNPEDMNCGITEALKTTSKKAKKVVFIGRREDQLVELVKRANSDSYVRMEENIKFTDFTDESQEKLLERVLLFFEATL